MTWMRRKNKYSFIPKIQYVSWLDWIFEDLDKTIVIIGKKCFRKRIFSEHGISLLGWKPYYVYLFQKNIMFQFNTVSRQMYCGERPKYKKILVIKSSYSNVANNEPRIFFKLLDKLGAHRIESVCTLPPQCILASYFDHIYRLSLTPQIHIQPNIRVHTRKLCTHTHTNTHTDSHEHTIQVH